MNYKGRTLALFKACSSAKLKYHFCSQSIFQRFQIFQKEQKIHTNAAGDFFWIMKPGTCKSQCTLYFDIYYYNPPELILSLVTWAYSVMNHPKKKKSTWTCTKTHCCLPALLIHVRLIVNSLYYITFHSQVYCS